MTPWCAHRPLIVVGLHEILKALDFSLVILIPSKILFGSCQASRGLDFCAREPSALSSNSSLLCSPAVSPGQRLCFTCGGA